MPATSETTLGRRAGNDAIAQIIALYARNQAKAALEAFPDGGAGKHVEALNGTADFISTRSQEDQRIYTMYRLQAHQGDSDRYEPGENASLLFGRLGMGGGANAPLPDATLNELVAAPVDASEGKVKRIFNTAGDDLYYRTDPGVSSSNPSLKNGESKVIRDRVWLVTTGETKVIVEPVSEV